MVEAADYEFMAHALRLAARGMYTTTPNPRVGSVVVKLGSVVGMGWHERAGEPHAEIRALGAAGAQARGATVYVTLEPCHHQGRTGPCDQALISAGVVRVVVAMRDPDPRTLGLGIDRLQRAGIDVDVGVLELHARELNAGFVSRLARHRPWTRLKMATSIDGKTALANGSSRWITGEAARRDTHRWRARACAILTGIGTIRSDDAQLTVREIATSRQPLRVIVDSALQTPLNARALADGNALIVCAYDDQEKSKKLRDLGVDVIAIPDKYGKVDLPALLTELARREINELHVEAGATLSGALLEAGCVDELLLYMAPHFLGDRARGMVELPELSELPAKHQLEIHDVRLVGADIRIIARVKDR